MFRESNNFHRNLEYQLDKPQYSNLNDNSHYSLISTWNNIHRFNRDWLKESHKKRLNYYMYHTKNPISNNIELKKFGLNSLKNL